MLFGKCNNFISHIPALLLSIYLYLYMSVFLFVSNVLSFLRCFEKLFYKLIFTKNTSHAQKQTHKKVYNFFLTWPNSGVFLFVWSLLFAITFFFALSMTTHDGKNGQWQYPTVSFFQLNSKSVEQTFWEYGEKTNKRYVLCFCCVLTKTFTICLWTLTEWDG